MPNVIWRRKQPASAWPRRTFIPKFRLFGTIGLESLSSGDFLEWASRTWSIGPGVSWNIFHGGAIRQNIEVQTARQEQALIQYEAAVLSAQEEVENILVAYAKEQLRRESLAKAATAAQRTASYWLRTSTRPVWWTLIT